MPEMGRLGDKAKCEADAHGCPKCPHTVEGEATKGSEDVDVNYKAALREGDEGVHAGCCGKNKWDAQTGSWTVYINNKMAHRKGDVTVHCGGIGELKEGSPGGEVGG